MTYVGYLLYRALLSPAFGLRLTEEDADNSVAGAAGFEPAMAGSKPAALTTWPRPSNFFFGSQIMRAKIDLKPHLTNYPLVRYNNVGGLVNGEKC